MKIEGKLNLHNKTCEYIMFSEGRLTNISEILNIQLMDDVYICVKDVYTNEVLFRERGQLIKNRIDKGFYLYHVDGQDLDSVLWDNVGQRLCIEIENISKR